MYEDASDTALEHELRDRKYKRQVAKEAPLLLRLQREVLRNIGVEAFCTAFRIKHEYSDCSDAEPKWHEPKRPGESARCLRCHLVVVAALGPEDVFMHDHTLLNVGKEGIDHYV